MGDDLVTLHEHPANSEGGMIILSKQFDRQPYGETPVRWLYERPFIPEKPKGQEWCNGVHHNKETGTIDLCGWRPEDKFYLNKNNKSGLDHYCMECRDAMSGDYYLRHADELKAKRRKHYADRVLFEQERKVRRYFKAPKAA